MTPVQFQQLGRIDNKSWRITELINGGGVCKTAPATLGLLDTVCKCLIMNTYAHKLPFSGFDDVGGVLWYGFFRVSKQPSDRGRI